MSAPELEPSTLDPRPKPRPGRGLVTAAVVLALVAAGIVAEGAVSRVRSGRQLEAWTEAQAIPAVRVVSPSPGGSASSLELPGRLEAYRSAPIYARVPGYLKSWKYDIGARVKAGDLLAEIETPDLDQQLLQARADLASAQANAALAETTAARWNAMLGSDSVSKQEVDEKTGDYATKKALVNSAQANVNRLVATKAFTRILAPFDGVVTARSTDIGALINAGSGGGPELFVVSATAKLRVYVSVPQQYVPSVPPGTRATITVPEHPDRTYAATVEASSQAVDAASGTTLMQLLVDNAHGELMPGGYASLKLNLADHGEGLTIPASALIFGADGLTVATVGADGRVEIKPVTVQRDLGQRIEIASGLAASDRVIDNPPDDIANGRRVNILDSPESSPSAPEVAATAPLHHDAS